MGHGRDRCRVVERYATLPDDAAGAEGNRHHPGCEPHRLGCWDREYRPGRLQRGTGWPRARRQPAPPAGIERLADLIESDLDRDIALTVRWLPEERFVVDDRDG
jgi:hypothetical protein